MDLQHISTDLESLPRTAVMSARVDIRALATIMKYFVKRGLMCRTRSELVRDAITVFAGMLHNSERVEHFQHTDEALRFMNSLGFDFGRIGQRGNLSLATQLQKEALEGDFGSIDYLEKSKSGTNLEEDEEYQKAVQLLKDIDDDNELRS